MQQQYYISFSIAFHLVITRQNIHSLNLKFLWYSQLKSAKWTSQWTSTGSYFEGKRKEFTTVRSQLLHTSEFYFYSITYLHANICLLVLNEWMNKKEHDHSDQDTPPSNKTLWNWGNGLINQTLSNGNIVRVQTTDHRQYIQTMRVIHKQCCSLFVYTGFGGVCTEEHCVLSHDRLRLRLLQHTCYPTHLQVAVIKKSLHSCVLRVYTTSRTKTMSPYRRDCAAVAKSSWNCG